jgi:hypothetical protein
MSAFPAFPHEGGGNMMWAGWPDHPGVCIRVTEYRRMPARRHPARAIAIAVAAKESRRRRVLIGIHCSLAVSLVIALAVAVF